jgi:hypothetical protein
MTRESQSAARLFTQVDVGPNAHSPAVAPASAADEQTRLLRDILTAQDRQNELLEELVSQLSAAQRQRNNELGQWKQANPRLARGCRMAADALSKVQTEFLETLTNEVNDNADEFLQGDFLLNEFVDRFGPRLAHLNGVIQVLVQLSSNPTPQNNNS